MTNDSEKIDIIRKHIKSYPDFPKKGVLFRDLFSILLEPKVFSILREVLLNRIKQNIPGVECIVALESRGFLIGPILALDLQIPFIPIRKKNKLPGPVFSQKYKLEYGEGTLEIQQDIIKDNMKILLVDDLLATGGSLDASCKLIEKCNGEVVACLVIMELESFKGASLINAPTHSILKY